MKEPSAKDDKPTSTTTRGAPVGTHSLTGGEANVGIPSSAPPEAKDGDETGKPRGLPPGSEEPDPLLDPNPGARIGETPPRTR
jgi:hypothetical protein